MSKEPITDPTYWANRLRRAKQGDLHTAVFKCPLRTWLEIEEKHREILAEHIGPNDSVLDVGCGWGRLLSLMPDEWEGCYAGVDLSNDFIEMARDRYPQRLFYCCDILHAIPHFGHHFIVSVPIEPVTKKWDWAVLISFRPMIRRNLGGDVWDEMEREIRRVAKRLLYLEYDVNDWSVE